MGITDVYRYMSCLMPELGRIAATLGLLTNESLMQNDAMIFSSTNSRWVVPLRSLFVGFGVFFLGSLSDVWLQLHAENRVIAIMDDALVGVGIGLLVLLYERRQRKNMIRQLEVIRQMNHHVRNSLQVISFASAIPQQEELANKIRDAVERIEWALREVLPGQREDIGNLSFHTQSNEPPAQKSKIVA